MTGEIIPLTKRKPRVVEAVEDADVFHDRSLDPRALAIERCADRIERALRQRLTVHERIGLERALDELVGEIEWHKREPWS